MSPVSLKPRRSRKSEIFPLLFSLLLPVAVFVTFPRQAFSFTPRPVAASVPASCAWVELTPEEESSAYARARSVWHVSVSDVRRAGASLSDLPPVDFGDVLSFAARANGSAAAVETYRPAAPVLVGAADDETALPAEDPGSPCAFSRAELLRLE